MNAEKLPHIGTLNENALHAALKAWCTLPNDKVEVEVDGFVVDILRGEEILEIQTGNFSSIRRKLSKLTKKHSLQLVHPIPAEKWIVKLDEDGTTPISRRKSPKRGSFENVFQELVSFPKLLRRTNFSIRICLIQSEEIRVQSKNWTWRTKGWKTIEQRLLSVKEERVFQSPDDLAQLLPEPVPGIFTTEDIAHALGRPRRLAQRMAYCLRELEMIVPVGRQGNAIRYRRNFTPQR
jgi:hypothetical protein